MRARPLLLRLLLCLVLVANGTTAAFANVRMVMDRDAVPAAAMHHEDATPCHGEDDDDAATHDGDCCGTPACLCSCLVHAAAFLTVDAFALASPPAASPAFALHGARASPVLPHPIRPPIG